MDKLNLVQEYKQKILWLHQESTHIIVTLLPFHS